jgi:hypothetical protein
VWRGEYLTSAIEKKHWREMVQNMYAITTSTLFQIFLEARVLPLDGAEQLAVGRSSFFTLNSSHSMSTF